MTSFIILHIPFTEEICESHYLNDSSGELHPYLNLFSSVEELSAILNQVRPQPLQ